MREFHDIVQDVDSADRAMKKLDPDFGGFRMARYDSIVLELLRKLVGDTSESSWITFLFNPTERLINKASFESQLSLRGLKRATHNTAGILTHRPSHNSNLKVGGHWFFPSNSFKASNHLVGA